MKNNELYEHGLGMLALSKKISLIFYFFTEKRLDFGSFSCRMFISGGFAMGYACFTYLFMNIMKIYELGLFIGRFLEAVFLRSGFMNFGNGLTSLKFINLEVSDE